MSFNVARALFNQADTNGDGAVDRAEFNRFVAGAAATDGYVDPAYYSGYGAAAGVYGSGATSYEAAAYGAGLGAGYGGLAYDSTYLPAAGYVAGRYAGGVYDSSSALYNSQLAAAASQYPADAQGLYQDANPQIIRRQNPGGVQTYTQNIKVRFLQPPPVPPPGPLIIKEVRPLQPPVPPPLRLRQQAPPLPQLPPLVLRERPPPRPVSIASQTVIRRLAALPVPPRSVVIERLPPLPPRPRDVVIERWIPYGAQAKRRTLVQRAGPAQRYPAPRNVVIQYEPSPVRVLRQFERIGVAGANPAAYVQQYGGSLLDPSTLVQQARSAGVVEDISAPPPSSVAYGYGAATYGQDYGSYSTASGYDSALDAGYYGGYGGVYGSGYGGVYGSGYGGVYGTGYGGIYGNGALYDSYDGAYGLNGGYSSYDSRVYGPAGIDVAEAAFRNADLNNDGAIDPAEFTNFVQQGL